MVECRSRGSLWISELLKQRGEKKWLMDAPYKLFLIHGGCFQRRQLFTAVHRLTAFCTAQPSKGRKPACADLKKQNFKKGLLIHLFACFCKSLMRAHFFMDIKSALVFHRFIREMNAFISVQ